MSPFKVHIIHVGNMANKGTQALLISDVSTIKDIIKSEVAFSVSTTDIEGVKALKLPLNRVLPPMVDVPYERADFLARKVGVTRQSLGYKLFAIASTFLMFVQIMLSVISVLLIKRGLKVFYRAEVLRSLKECDVVVSYSDENFKESASMLPLNIYWIATWWSVLLSRTWEILTAKSLGKPVIMFPNSVGPFRTFIGRSLSKLSLNNCDYVLVREPISYAIVKSLKIKSHVILTSDTTLLFRPRHKLLFDRYPNPMLGVSPGIYSHCLSEKEIREYVMAYTIALDAAIEKLGVFVVFLPHYIIGFRYDDLEICKLIFQRMKNKDKAKIIKVSTVDNFKLIIDRMDMVISSKMHPAVLATSGHIPTVCIAYDHKQTGFFKSLGLSECVIPLQHLSDQSLTLKIEYVWNRRQYIRELLTENVFRLQKHVYCSIKEIIGYANIERKVQSNLSIPE